jgi:SOS-response transcriptional repressor LexA
LQFFSNAGKTVQEIRKRLLAAMGEMRAASLARKTGIADSTISRYLKDLDFSLHFTIAVCKAMNISSEWLLFGTGPMQRGAVDLEALSDEQVFEEFQKRMGGIVRKLGRIETAMETAVHKTYKVARVIEPGFDLVDVEQLPADWPGHYVPIIGRIAAGKGFDTVEAESRPAGLAISYLKAESSKSSFAVRVEGDSMEPKFHSGDLVIVDGNRRAKGGVCVVLQKSNGQRVARIKKLSLRGRLAVLSSTNPRHPDIEVPAQDVEAFEIVKHLPARRENQP